MRINIVGYDILKIDNIVVCDYNCYLHTFDYVFTP